MVSATSRPDLPRAPDLPAWMGTLRDRYLNTDTSQFILHGNVHDTVLAADRAWDMPEFLDAFFAPSDKLVVHFDPGRGVWFPDERHAARAARALLAARYLDASKVAPRGADKTPEKALAEAIRDELAIERDPGIVLPVLEALLVRHDMPCAVIIHYAELVAPHGDPASLGFDDRTAAARLHRWSLSTEVNRSDNVVLLLTSTMSDLASRVTRNPRVGAIHVPLPGALERARFLARLRPDLGFERGEKVTRVTAGLQLRQIKDLMAAVNGSGELPLDAIAERKREILEQECFGLIEVLEPDHDFSVVGGNEPIKAALSRIAEHVKAGRRAQVPMGVLLVGPMGTGKSFLAEAFAKESGLAAIKLKNFRDKWVGSTEANLEKILNVIEGLGEILVIIDEGDRSLGGEAEGDSGVNSRVIARLKEFMSDPDHRGRIVFMLMTNRPDKLDTDMKRPGRFDLKIPFFSPQNAEERAAILRAQVRRHRIPADLPDEALLPILEGLQGFAAADLEALLLLAYDDYESGHLPTDVTERPPVLTAPFLAQAAHDFMPTREVDMIAYMELLAVQEASNRRLLPERFRDITLEELATRLTEARYRALRPRT